MSNPVIQVHEGDLPEGLSLGSVVAVDTETTGLKPERDRLCLVQLSAGDKSAHLVRISPGGPESKRLKALLSDHKVLKIFHYARFDVAMLKRHLGVDTAPIYCTKIASKLARTYTDRHGLKDVVHELLGLELSKQQQSSDWGAEKLSDAQLSYAAADVLHLHQARAKLDVMLEREGRMKLAEAVMRFVPTRAALDLAGFEDQDIFNH